MDHSVPSWSELLRDATNLARKQRECYRDVHHLLDTAIPELDKKIESCILEDSVTKCSSDQPIFSDRHGGNNYTSTPNVKSDSAKRSNQQQPSTRTKCVTIEPNPSIISERISPSMQTPFESDILIDYHQDNPVLEESLNPSSSHDSMCSFRVLADNDKERYDIDDLEHLKPLPMPLMDYFRMNRPELMARAHYRAQHMKQKSERRKINASSLFANQLAAMKSTERKKRNKPLNKPTKTRVKDQTYIHYPNTIKYNFTEKEIRQQTNKRYQSLPEVRKKVDEEINNYKKLQNYRNKIQYGRKLLQNRRQGKINYPLIATSDDVSLSSYQEDFSSGDYERGINEQCNAFSMI